MDKYECTVCGYIYDEAEGDPDNGVAAGTKWMFRLTGYVLCAVPQKTHSRKCKTLKYRHFRDGIFLPFCMSRVEPVMIWL